MITGDYPIDEMTSVAETIFPERTSLRDMVNNLTIVTGDLARAVRDAYDQGRPVDRVELSVELGNLVLTGIRYLADLDLNLVDSLNAAGRRQAEYFSTHRDGRSNA